VSAAKSGILLVLAFVALSAALFLVLGPYQLDKILGIQFVLISGAALFLFLLNWPETGVAALLVGGLLVAYRVGTGTETGINGAVGMSIVISLVWLFHVFYHPDKYPPVRSRSVVPVLVFMAAVLLSTLVGQYPWFPAARASLFSQLGQLSIFLLSGAVFLVSACYLRNIVWLKRVVVLFFAIGLIHLSVRVVPGAVDYAWGRLPLIIHSGSMFWTWLVALSFGQFFLNRDLGPAAKLLAGGIAAGSVGVTLIQTGDWVSGWFPSLVSIFIIVLARYPYPVVVASPILATLGWLGVSFVTNFAASEDNLYSLSTRWEALRSLQPVLMANPIFGLGPANYYNYTVLYPIMGWYVSYSSHNNYLDLVAQAGLVGLASFLWFAWVVGMIAWHLKDRVVGGFERGYVYGVVGGLVASVLAGALGDWIIPFVYIAGFEGFRTSVLFWLFLGGVVAIEQREAGR